MYVPLHVSCHCRFGVVDMMFLDEKLQSPYTTQSTKADFTKPNPKSGAVQLSFNVNGTLLLARYESSPRIVYLYSFPHVSDLNKNSNTGSEPLLITPRLRSVLIHSNNVTAAKWSPVRKGHLVVCCGGSGLYLWSDEWVDEGEGSEGEEVAECVGIPASES